MMWRLLLLLLLAAACGAAPGIFAAEMGPAPGVQVPYPPDPTQETRLYLSSLTVTLFNSTLVNITSQYFYYNIKSGQKGYEGPVYWQCTYSLSGSPVPSNMFVACTPGYSCQQPSIVFVNLCGSDVMTPFYTGPWGLQVAPNAYSNGTAAIGIGNSGQAFAGLPLPATLYCQGTCPVLTVPASNYVMASPAGALVDAGLLQPATSALNLTVGDTSYLIPTGYTGSAQVQSSFTTRFQWGTSLSDPVSVSLTAIGSRVTIGVQPFSVFSSPPNYQALIVATDPIPLSFRTQLSGGLQSGATVGFLNLQDTTPAATAVYDAVPYINYYQRLVFASKDAYFGGASPVPYMSSYGGLSHTYTTNAAGAGNCTDIHWLVPGSFVDMGDVQIGGIATVNVTMINSGTGTVSYVRWFWRGRYEDGWGTLDALFACPVPLLPGASCVNTVTFNSSGAAAGLHGLTMSAAFQCSGQTLQSLMTISELGFQVNAIAGVPTTGPPTTAPPPTSSQPPGAFAYYSNFGPCCLTAAAVEFRPSLSFSDLHSQFFAFTLSPALNYNMTNIKVTILAPAGEARPPDSFEIIDPTNCPGPGACHEPPQSDCNWLNLTGGALKPGNTCWTSLAFLPRDGGGEYWAFLLLEGIYAGNEFVSLSWKLVGGLLYGNGGSWSGGVLAGAVTAGVTAGASLATTFFVKDQTTTSTTTTGGYAPKTPISGGTGKAGGGGEGRRQ